MPVADGRHRAVADGDGLLGVVGYAAGAARRRRLEADPAGAGEEQLGPGVQVVGAVDALVLVRPVGHEEADRDPRRDAELAGHHGHRGGELLAVAGPAVLALAEEPDQVVGAVAEVDLVVVGEAAVLAEPLLERHRLLEAGRLRAGHLLGELAHHRVEVGGQLGELAVDQGTDRGSGGQPVGVVVELDGLQRPRQLRGVQVVVAGQEVHGLGVVAPVARGLDAADLRGRGQPAWTGSRGWPRARSSYSTRSSRLETPTRPGIEPSAVWVLGTSRSPELHSLLENRLSTAIRR